DDKTTWAFFACYVLRVSRFVGGLFSRERRGRNCDASRLLRPDRGSFGDFIQRSTGSVERASAPNRVRLGGYQFLAIEPRGRRVNVALAEQRGAGGWSLPRQCKPRNSAARLQRTNGEVQSSHRQ